MCNIMNHNLKNKTSRENQNPKICLYCGKEFIPIRSSKNFCNKKCRESYYRKEGYYKKDKMIKIKKRCEYCGKIFFTSKEESCYCSKECKEKDYELIFPIRKSKSESKLDEKNKEAIKQNKSYGEYIAEKDGTIPTAEQIIESYKMYLLEQQIKNKK